MLDDGRAAVLTNVTKRYRRGNQEVVALRDVSLAVMKGEFVALMGPSGSGKSTLLNLVGGLDVPDEGDVWVDGRSLSAATDNELTDMRRTRVGVVFQFFNLLPNITALENVMLPLRAAGMRRRDMLERASEALSALGLEDRREHLPSELSGGEMQRVAIARALVIRPAMVLADEPTGNLDSTTGADILGVIRRCSRERGVTVVMVTHSAIAAGYGDRVVSLRDGQVVDEVVNRSFRDYPQVRPVH